MQTNCNGAFGSRTITGGFYVGKRPVVPVSVAQQMKYKGQPSGPRMKQDTVMTRDIHGNSTSKKPVLQP